MASKKPTAQELILKIEDLKSQAKKLYTEIEQLFNQYTEQFKLGDEYPVIRDGGIKWVRVFAPNGHWVVYKNHDIGERVKPEKMALGAVKEYEALAKELVKKGNK